MSQARLPRRWMSEKSIPSSRWDSLDCCQGEDEVHRLALVLDMDLVRVASCGQSCRPQHPCKPGISPCDLLLIEPLELLAPIFVVSLEVHLPHPQ
eukprot:2642079-Amphidinium_carterae.1